MYGSRIISIFSIREIEGERKTQCLIDAKKVFSELCELTLVLAGHFGRPNFNGNCK